MLNASPRFRYYLGFTLLLLLVSLLIFSGQAQQPTPGPATRAATYTRSLTRVLQLQPHQYQPVYRCTLRCYQAQESLTAAGALMPGALADVEQRYAAAVLPWLAAGQYNGFALLLARQPTDLPGGDIAIQH